jgi:hypothetical protein|uniref:Uncharacterized protein n=1 Tax=Globisporangium ultimum (strain ATCC 200006 / CBS 805.95 / DAOM BR144) TaxID=431595 RepID=K3X914_GLOUD
MACNTIKVGTEVTPLQTGTTLLSTHWLPEESIVAEFLEEPDCGLFNWCQNGSIRKTQLTTHRLFFLQATRTWCCLKKVKKPEMRQVFIQDIAEISIGDYSDTQTAFKVLKIIVGLALIIGGLVLAFYKTHSYEDDDSSMKIPGYILIAFGFVVLILSQCRSTVPQVIFGTRCPQVGLFSIKLRKAADRVRLLEHVSTLIHAHHKK